MQKDHTPQINGTSMAAMACCVVIDPSQQRCSASQKRKHKHKKKNEQKNLTISRNESTENKHKHQRIPFIFTREGFGSLSTGAIVIPPERKKKMESADSRRALSLDFVELRVLCERSFF
jgi:mannitol-specific phosphotransferase system IIBC component